MQVILLFQLHRQPPRRSCGEASGRGSQQVSSSDIAETHSAARHRHHPQELHAGEDTSEYSSNITVLGVKFPDDDEFETSSWTLSMAFNGEEHDVLESDIVFRRIRYLLKTRSDCETLGFPCSPTIKKSVIHFTL